LRTRMDEWGSGALDASHAAIIPSCSPLI